jgi:hypothetical protein
VEDLYANEVEAEIEDLQAVAKHTLVEGDQIFSCGDEDGEVEVVGGPLIIRPGSSLCFANAEAIKDQVMLHSIFGCLSVPPPPPLPPHAFPDQELGYDLLEVTTSRY